MNTRRSALQVLFTLIVALPAWLPAAFAGEPAALPDDSVYHLDMPLVDHEGRSFHLADRRGRPQLVSMFYSSCPYVCPLIIDTLRMTQRALPANDSKKLDILMVSLDPERDTPTRLKQVFGERKLDAASWTLARTDAANVRKLAAILGIQYRVLKDGGINHSTSLLLLDANGRIVAQSGKTGELDADLVAAIERTFAAD
jgi:protein SCO1/2